MQNKIFIDYVLSRSSFVCLLYNFDLIEFALFGIPVIDGTAVTTSHSVEFMQQDYRINNIQAKRKTCSSWEYCIFSCVFKQSLSSYLFFSSSAALKSARTCVLCTLSVDNYGIGMAVDIYLTSKYNKRKLNSVDDR